MFVITETWLNPSIADSELLQYFPDFNIFRRDRTNKRGGGVLIGSHKSLQCTEIRVSSCLEITFILCNASYPPTIIGVCYRPPGLDPLFVPNFHVAIHSVTKTFRHYPILLFGDFNFPAISWNNLASTAAKHGPESDFVNSCLTFGLTQLVTEPTRQNSTSSNTLDLILTSEPDKVSKMTFLPGLSDHSVIHGTYLCQLTRSSKITKTITLYNKGNYSALNNEFAEFATCLLADFSQRSVETNWLLFKNKIHDLFIKYMPTITVTEKKTSPWFTATLKRLNNKKKRLFRSAKRSNNISAWNNYYAAEKAFSTHAMKEKRSFYSQTLPAMLTNNPKKFWSVINPQNSQPLALFDNHNLPIPDDEAAEQLNHFFSSMFTIEPNGNLPSFHPRDYDMMPDITFSQQGIAKLIDSLKLTSSCGADGINAKMLKNTQPIVSVILCHIFQQSLSSGVVPEDWKVGKIVPVPKKGPPSQPSSYRPISLTSICSKLMEHVIYSNTVKFLNRHNFFHHSQHGFRSGLSCDTQLASFYNDISSSVDLNIPTDALFLDFEKAFDKVPHQRLLLKLSCLNINTSTFNWIRSFLTNRQQFVYANNHSSNHLPVISGVPQGTVLGPLLFLIYINDLPANISSNIRLFADDCVVYRPIKNPTDIAILQNDLNLIESWCNDWLMSLNVNKTSLISFHRRQHYQQATYTISGSTILTAESYKYLGVTFSSNLTWSTHVNNVASSANRALGLLRRNLKLAPSSVKLLAYTTFVRPKLEYACSVWDPHQSNLSNLLESVQNRAARFIYSVYSYHSSVSELKTRGHLNNLESRRHISRLCLFHKFYHAPFNVPAILPAHRLSSRTNHPRAVYPPPAQTTAHLRSFFVATARDWNNLPAFAMHHSDPHVFKTVIESLICC